MQVDQPYSIRPYSLSIKQMLEYFGYPAQSVYNMINTGRLERGYHYLKVGGKLVTASRVSTMPPTASLTPWTRCQEARG